MAVRDGAVVWLGSDEVGLAQFPEAEVVDLDGGFVAPAFVDSHVHVTATGLMLAGLDLRAATSAGSTTGKSCATPGTASRSSGTGVKRSPTVGGPKPSWR